MSTIPNNLRNSRLARCLLLLATALLGAKFAGAAILLDLAQVPASSTFKSIAPNLIYMLDDSGSMQWEFLGTKGSIANYAYGYPPGATKVYGGQNYGNDFPSFSADNYSGAQYRSFYVNPNYYNPAVTYTPWACTGKYPESSTDSASNYTPTQYAGDAPACHWDHTEKLWLMPDADPRKAMLNPSLSGAWRSLDVWNDSADGDNATLNNGYSANASTVFKNGSTTVSKVGFWPAVYFNYGGPFPGGNADYSSISNYQQVQICPPAGSATTNSNHVKSTDTVTVAGSAMQICLPPPALPASPATYKTYLDAEGNYVYVKGDGTRVVRPYAAEMQNFANWYQYYRSHILLARAGTGKAFMQLQPSFRVDFALLNSMAVGYTPLQTGDAKNFSTVHAFDNSTYRSMFMDYLYKIPIGLNSTPSRNAVYNVGRWLEQTPSDTAAPWGPRDKEKPQTYSDLTCRQNYLVFVTDGDWNGGGPTLGNVDNTQGAAISGPNNPNYTYAAVAPYKDSYSNTLADVAMYFWKRDLQPNMSNIVPSDSSSNPAFWQHMVLFGVGLGVKGSPNQSSMIDGTASWPDPTQSALYRIDDLAHAGLNLHGGYLSAADPTEFAQRLGDTLGNILSRTQSSSSAAVNTQFAGQFKTTTQAFFSSYHPSNWWGQLMAYPLYRDTNGYLAIASTANWDAHCVLTGGPCTAMGVDTNGNATTTVTKQDPTARTILTWDDVGHGGVPFEFSSLSAAMQTQINSAMVDYLRGVRTAEQANGGALRTRTSVLGDLVDSSPVWVGPPAKNYPASWTDRLYAGAEPESDYGAWKAASAQAQRQQIVYIGGNDGLLHGFRAGSNDASGHFTTATNDGHEVLAYLPAGVSGAIGQYADPKYKHRFYVNATPASGDLFYGNDWHTWLVGGLGAGGQSIYVLDVTDPAAFSEANASTLVRQEVTPGNIDVLCGGLTGSGVCGGDLGYTFGAPIIRRMHNGQWAVIFGNGYNSANGHGVVFIALVDPTSGALSVKKIDTGAGPAQDPTGAGRANGMANVAAVDLDADNIADYLYATDLFGNVWRIDVTGSSASSWTVSTYGGSSAQPLYSAKDPYGAAQPVTTGAVVSVVQQASGADRVVVTFATGKMLESSDAAPGSQIQTVYGIWDWDMAAWNARNSAQYASLSGSQGLLARGNLQQQTIGGPYTESGAAYAGVGTGYRTLSSNPVCWKGGSGVGGCTTYDKYGWYVDLTDGANRPGEEVIYNPAFTLGAIQVNTTIPSIDSGLTCTAPLPGGWTMAFDPGTGGAFKDSFYANSQKQFVTINGAVVMGIALSATGSPTVITDNGRVYDILQGSGGNPPNPQLINPPGGSTGGRLTWIQLR